MKMRMAYFGIASVAALIGIEVPGAGAMMKSKVPSVDVPDINVPKVPKNIVPDVDVPKVTTPNAPKVTAPAVNTPKVTAPAVNSPDVTAPRIATPEPPKLNGVDPTKRPMPVPVDNAAAPKITSPDAPKLDAVDPMKRPMPVPAETATTAVDPGAAKPKRVLPTPQKKATPAVSDSASASTSGSASTSSGAAATKPAEAATTPGKLTKKWPPEPAAAAETPVPDRVKPAPGSGVAATTPVDPNAAKPKRVLPTPQKKATPAVSDPASASTSTSAPKAKSDAAGIQYDQLPADKQYAKLPPEGNAVDPNAPTTTRNHAQLPAAPDKAAAAKTYDTVPPEPNKQYTKLPPEPATVDPNAPKAVRTGHGELPASPEMLPEVPGAQKQYVKLPPEPATVDPNAPKSLPTGHAQLPAQINYGKVPDLGGTPPEVKATPARKLGETVGASPEDIASAERNKLGQVAAPGVGLPNKPKAAAASGDPAVKQPKRSNVALSNDNDAPAAAAATALPAKPSKSKKVPLSNDNDAPAAAAVSATSGGAVRRVQQMPAPQAVASATPSVTPSQIVGRRQLRPVQGGAVNGAATSSTGVTPPNIRKFN